MRMMKMRSLRLLSFSFPFSFSILAYLLISPASCLSILPNDAFALFIFGDGQYDTGNNVYRDPNSRFNGFPYGQSLGNISTGRPSDGYLTVDFIAAKSGLPPIKPYLERATKEWHYGVNFAIVGASVLFDDADLAFSMQLDQFEDVVAFLNQTYGHAQTQRLLSNSVYLITLGTDDFLRLEPNSTYDLNLVIGNYTTAISRIYDLGGRKFGVQGIGPLEKMPYPKFLWSGKEFIEEIKTTAETIDFFLVVTLENSRLSLKGFKYAYFNYLDDSFLTNLTSSFNATAACCGSESYNGKLTCGIEGAFEVCSDPNDHLWFDGVYTTQAVNEKIANEFWSGTNEYVVGPNNLQALFQDNASTKFAAI